MGRITVGLVIFLLGIVNWAGSLSTSSRPWDLRDSLIFCGVGAVLVLWGGLAIYRRRTAERIRWWRLAAAVRDLQDRAVGASAHIQYLMAFLVFELFSWGIDSEIYEFPWNNNRTHALVVGLGIAAAKILGPVAAYWLNGHRNGEDFLSRFFVLSLPIRIRVLVLTLLLAIPAEFLGAAIEGALGLPHQPVFRGAGVGIFWLVVNAAHYVWLAVVIRRMRQAQTPREVAQPVAAA